MEATSSASPVPASQAENDSMRMARMVEDDVCVWIGHMARATYIDSIMLSKHNRAEIRWVRWKARPRLLNVKAEKKHRWRRGIEKAIG